MIMDTNKIERIGIHKVGLFFLENFGWIERKQPISDNKFYINNDNFISKFKYIKICDEVVEYFNILFKELKNKDFQELKEYILDFEVEVSNKYNDMSNESYRLSAEIFQLKIYKNNIVDFFYNILIVFLDKARTDSNLKNRLNMYLKNIEKKY